MDSTEVFKHLADDRGRLVERIGVSALALIVANTSILFFYIAYDLTLFQLVVVLWVECFWIGFFSAVKIITASILGSPYDNKYVAVSTGGNVILSILAIAFVGGEFVGLFGLTGLVIAFAKDAFDPSGMSNAMLEDTGLILGSASIFFAGHGLSFVINFIVLGEYKTARVGTLLMLPFKRSLALLGAIAIAFGVMFALPRFASTTAFAVLLIALKILWDYRLHTGERKALAERD